jgi:hypothetical protein
MSKCDVARAFPRPEGDPRARGVMENDSNVRRHREHATRTRSAACVALFSIDPRLEARRVMNSVKQVVVYKVIFLRRVAATYRCSPRRPEHLRSEQLAPGLPRALGLARQCAGKCKSKFARRYVLVPSHGCRLRAAVPRCRVAADFSQGALPRISCSVDRGWARPEPVGTNDRVAQADQGVRLEEAPEGD